jgi:hypothetical protein
MALHRLLVPGASWEYPLRVLAVSASVLYFSRHLLSLKVGRPVGSLLLGVCVFVIWIGPDLIWPGYRGHWLFRNPVLGTSPDIAESYIRPDVYFLTFRVLGSVILVPIIEELFWRGWLMRYLISSEFLGVPLGTYAARSFWISALLFASEHGPYWEVGLAAGVLYGWWIVRTKNLSDCILAHAVTNGCLAVYVILGRNWQYWP